MYFFLNLGFLRLFLAFCVILGHSGGAFGYYFTALVSSVQLFYIISGFYMSMVLEEKYKNAYAQYYINRFLKIFPIYWIVLLITVGFSVAGYYAYGEWRFFSPHQPMNIDFFKFHTLNHDFNGLENIPGFILMNLMIIGQCMTKFFEGTLSNFAFVPQAWTIELELLFYAMAPFIVRRKTWQILTAIFLLLCLRVIIYLKINSHPWGGWAFCFFPTELALFMMGIISHRVYYLIRQHKTDESKLMLMGLLFFFMIFFYETIHYSVIGIPFPWNVHLKRWSLYFFAVLAIPCLHTVSQKKMGRISKKIAELSYPIYITHFLFIPSIIIFMTATKYEPYLWLVSFLVSLVFSIILIQITSPIERYREKIIRNKNAS